MKEKTQVLAVGDPHGKGREIKETLRRLNIRDAYIILVGDSGFGFESNDTSYLDLVEPNNLEFLTLRGNHDDPSYWDGTHDEEGKIRFVQDHSKLELVGKTFYFIGGGISIDKHLRKVGIDYWPAERIVKKYRDLPGTVDFLISHESPLSFQPILLRREDWGPEMWEELRSEKEYLDWIIGTITVREKWVYGHYHKSYRGYAGGIRYAGLDINEIIALV